MGSKRRIAAVSSVAAAALCLCVTPTVAAPSPPQANLAIVAGPGSVVINYATSTMILPQGDGLTFVNADIQDHDVVVLDSAGKVVASTPLVARGKTPTVTGAESLAPGTYTFYCTPHFQTMFGTLEVIPPPATPQPPDTQSP